LRLETAAQVWGTDISVAALSVAAENAQRLRAPLNLVACDSMTAIAGRSVDLIVSNPPYVPAGEKAWLQREVRDYEPSAALFAGPTGLEMYERLVADAERVLRPRGWIVLELGFGSKEHVEKMFGRRWENCRVVPDLAGFPRVFAAEFHED